MVIDFSRQNLTSLAIMDYVYVAEYARLSIPGTGGISHPLEVVSQGRETRLQLGEKLNFITLHFKSLIK